MNQGSNWRLLTLIASTFGAAAACGGAPETPDAVASDAADAPLVGVTDFAEIEATFGLKPNTPATPVDVTALRQSDCFKALMNGPPPRAFEHRRYQNGALFFARLGEGLNSGQQRPVLCVDLHVGAAPRGSLSGVALDAVLRYKLGALEQIETIGETTSWRFARGGLFFQAGAEKEVRFASAQQRPHEQAAPFEAPMTIAGPLQGLDLRRVATSGAPEDVAPYVPATQRLSLSGEGLALVYRYAWRKAEETGVFTVADDAVGTFTGQGWHVSGDFFDSYGATFSKVGLGYAMYLEDDFSTVAYVVKLSAREEPVVGRPPLAECARKDTSPDVPMTPYQCTGI